MKRVSWLPVALMLLAGVERVASAAEYPEEYTQRPQTLPEKMVELRSGVALDLSAGRAVTPVVDVGFRWGVTDMFELGVHAAFVSMSSSLVTTQGLSARGILWHSDNASLSLAGGANVTRFAENAYHADAAASLDFYVRAGERFATRTGVRVSNPLSYRSAFFDTYGVYVEPSVNITSSFATFLRLESTAAFSDFETTRGGLSVGAIYTLDTRFDFGASFALPGLVSSEGLKGEARGVSATFRWRLDAR